jgi:DNA-binding Lrp family transcriptional regulator
VLDDKDRRILEALREDAQETTKAIAQKTGIPRTTVHDRISRMEDRGVIRQYTVVPDYEALGQSTTAFVFLAYDARASVSQQAVAGELADIDAVCEVHMISGDWDLIAKVRAESIEQIGDLVVERVREVGGVAKTQTSTVFRTWKDEI